MSGHSVQWLLNRVNADVKSFFDAEFQVREESLRQQEILRSEIKNLEERCVHAEQDLQARNSRIADLEMEMDRKIRQYQERISHLESAAQEDGKTIVDMRDTERTLRSELDQFASKLRLAEEQASQDERTINDLRDVSARLLQENEFILHQNATLEDRCQHQEQKLRRMLDEMGGEVGRLRGEVDRQRRELEISSNTYRPTSSVLTSTSPRITYSPSRAPTSPSTSTLPRNREVNVSIWQKYGLSH